LQSTDDKNDDFTNWISLIHSTTPHSTTPQKKPTHPDPTMQAIYFFMISERNTHTFI